MADNPLVALFKLTPSEAVDYLQQRGQLTQSFNWQDVWQEEHAYQFTVSRLANMDLLQAIQDGITKNVQGDLSRRDWMKNTQALLEQAGWWGKNEVLDPSTGERVTTTFDSARLKLIFDTNTRMAYAAGLWQRIERNKASHPYIRYITMQDERVRLSHRPWNNVTLPVDDPFWDTHFPPNGWRCRCRAMSINQQEYDAGLSPNGERLNKKAPKVETREWVNTRTGVVEQVPMGIDPGFAYNPGKAAARTENLAQVQTQKLAAVAPALAKQYCTTDELAKQAEAFVSQALADRASKQVALALTSVPDLFSSIADKINGVKTAGKQMALDHDSVLHIIDEHSSDSELARGQIPIDALDFVIIADALQNPVSVTLGNPVKSNNGAYRLEAILLGSGWRYSVIFEVRRLYIVPFTMWKWVQK